MSVGAGVGLIASFWQMLEKLTLLKNAHAVLSCNLNSVFNCTNILNAHQSSVFGFPNSLMCIVFFALMLSAGLIGLGGAQLHKRVRFAYQAFALFFVGFGFWYLWQSIFNIGALCIFCIFCYGGLLLVNGSWFRLNYRELPLRKKTIALLDEWVGRGADIFVWCLVAAAITLEAIIKFA